MGLYIVRVFFAFVFFGSVSCWPHGSSTGSLVRIAVLVALLVLG